jgi:hypothetical protein
MPAEGAEKTYVGFDLEKIASENPGYARIFMNSRKSGGTTLVSLTRDKGDKLYIVSNVFHERISDYLRYREEGLEAEKEAPVEAEDKPKRKKQSSLLSFLKK